MPLARSIEEPPPTAIRPSQPSLRYCAAAWRTIASVGLEGVSSNTATGSPSSASIARCAMPAATTPLSVTSSGRRMPMRSHSDFSSLTAPKSRWIWVR
ncbi:hypothetical protein OJJOAM_000349 [Cupriavidus sp. H18C1]